MTTSSSGRYDAVIVGGGHNGLTCAAYLARAGRRVLVLEGRSVVGGMATTEETVAAAPGFAMNPCALDLVLTNLEHSIVDELGLSDYGLRLYDVDPYGTWLRPDGLALRFWADVDRTVEQINRFSRKDGESYRKLVELSCDLWHCMLPYMQGHPTRPKARTLAELAWRAGKHRKSLLPGARLMLSSAASVLDEWFERDEIKSALAGWAGVGLAPMDEQGTGGLFGILFMTHRWPAKRAIGGMGALSDALQAHILRHGGEIRVDVPVQSVTTRSGRAVGVELESGEQIHADHVIGAVDPITLFSKLVDPADLPEQTLRELRGIATLRHGVGLLKADVAIDRRPTLPSFADEEELLRSGYLILAPDREYVGRAVLSSMRGELSDDIPMWLAVPSVFDRTLVPPGSSGDSLWLYSMAVPTELSGGRDWLAEKDAYLARCLKVAETYAPGLSDTVIGSYVHSPVDLAKKAHKGNVEHIDVTLSQMGPWRPTPSLGGYTSPIEHLWHTGAGAHPMPAVNGWSGRTAAGSVLKQLRRG